jgi:hypothetical protein
MIIEKIEQLKSSYSESGKEKTLRTLEKESSSDLKGGCNQTIFIKLKNDGSGIFKPKSGEKENLRTEIDKGTYYQRERAAYLVDMFLGFDLVPPTVIKEVEGEIGSFQEFIENAKTGYEIEKEHDEDMKKLWVFDFIIWNSDRHLRNFLFDKDEKKLHAIDHGLSFGKTGFRSPKFFYDCPIPNDIRKKIKNFISSEDKKSMLKNLLKELLPEDEVENCFSRIELINSKCTIAADDVKRLEYKYTRQYVNTLTTTATL